MSQPTSIGEELRQSAYRHAGIETPPAPDTGRLDEVEHNARARRDELWPRQVGRRFADARVDQLEGPLRELAERWDGTSNVLLLGNVGVGKTHAAAAMAYVQHVDRGRTLIFRSAPLLLDGMRPSGDGQVRQQAIDVGLLVVDDLGSEKSSDWTAEQLGIVIDERYRQCRPTVVTSNLAPQHLRGQIGERAWSRLYEGAERHTIGGQDRRVA